MCLKIAACVILYHPDKAVEENIKSYINFIEKIYVIDNTEIKMYDEYFLSSYKSKTSFIYDGLNNGIAFRLNEACRLAIKDGFEFLLSMDQDSCFKEDSIATYLNCILNFQNKSNISMFGINHQKQTMKPDCSYNKTKHLITSGSIINLNVYKKIGNFDEALFIDFVDADYCFKSLLNSYNLIEFSNVFMHHEIGKTSQKKSFKNFKSTNRSIHSSVRLYYMVRNFLYLSQKYKSNFKTELTMYKKDLLNRIKNKLLYHNNRMQTLKFIIKAWQDYKLKKMGKQF